ncbi:hypothetical protein MMC31_006212, partial [Peltigera leucophlebia]|nr:hypothetical protein [Peltigera leucophlebia]
RLMNHSTSGYGKFTASRFLNREIKHVVADIHRTLLNSELHQLQESLQASDKQREFWGPVLVSMLSLAMVTEIMQHLVQCKASSERAGLDVWDLDYTQRIREIEKRASDEIADMEYVMQFLRDLFSRKYISQDVEKKKGFKPIFKASDRAILDVPSQRFAADLEIIIQKY